MPKSRTTTPELHSAIDQDTVYDTTHGYAGLRSGYITIHFGYLDAERQLHEIELNVDAFAVELACDLCAALSEQRSSEGIV